MQLNIKHNNDTNVTIGIIADTDTLTKIKQSTLRRFNKPSLKIPGFRAGKAPLELVEKNMDSQTLQSEFIDAVLNHYYSQAIIKENLRVVGQPTVNVKKFVPFTTFEFEVTVDVLGEVKLANYKNIKKKKDEIKISDQQVSAVIESLRTRMAEKTTVSREAKKGDEVTIDFTGTDAKGNPISGADGKDYPLILGSKTFIPGFEENLLGLTIGQDKKFSVTFPKDYSVKALQNKKVTFKVTIKDISSLQLPEVNDDFAKKAGPFENISSLKADIKRQLAIEKQHEADKAYETELLRDIAKKTSVAIPEIVIQEQAQRIEAEEKQQVIARGQTWKEHLDLEGISEEEHRQRIIPDAEEQVKIGVVLGAIGDRENITVTPEELEIRLQLLKGQYNDPVMQTELDKPEARQDIAARLRSEKIISKLTEYATK